MSYLYLSNYVSFDKSIFILFLTMFSKLYHFSTTPKLCTIMSRQAVYIPLPPPPPPPPHTHTHTCVRKERHNLITIQSNLIATEGTLGIVKSMGGGGGGGGGVALHSAALQTVIYLLILLSWCQIGIPHSPNFAMSFRHCLLACLQLLFSCKYNFG